MIGRAHSYRPPAPVILNAGPWKGMRDGLSPATDDPEYVNLCKNMFIRDPKNGGPFETRPAQRYASVDVTAEAQNVLQWDRIDGTTETILIAGAEIWKITYSLGFLLTVTLMVSGANLSSAGITIAGGYVYTAVLADTLIVSDGTSVPFSWDGTSGAGGLTKLTNCPVLTGPITVYYAKLFGVKNTEPSTLVWSEENDPTTGYEAGGFNNAWTLGQTAQGKILAIIATNEGLYYFRRASIGVIRGAVDVNFSASGVHDSVSTTEGTVAPRSVLLDGSTIYFTDARGRPWWFPIGGTPRPMFLNLERYYTHRSDKLAQPTSEHPDAYGRFVTQHLMQFAIVESLDIMLLGIVDHSLSGTYHDFDVFIAFSRETKEPLGYFEFHNQFHLMGPAYNLEHGVHSVFMGSATKYWFLDSSGDADNRDAEPTTGTPFIRQVLIGHAHGYQNNIRWAFGRFDMEIQVPPLLGAGDGDISFDAMVPPGIQMASPMTTTLARTGFHESVRIPVEYSEEGRWMRPIVIFSGTDATDDGFDWVSVNAWALTAQPLDKVPYKSSRSGV